MYCNDTLFYWFKFKHSHACTFDFRAMGLMYVFDFQYLANPWHFLEFFKFKKCTDLRNGFIYRIEDWASFEDKAVAWVVKPDNVGVGLRVLGFPDLFFLAWSLEVMKFFGTNYALWCKGGLHETFCGGDPNFMSAKIDTNLKGLCLVLKVYDVTRLDSTLAGDCTHKPDMKMMKENLFLQSFYFHTLFNEAWTFLNIPQYISLLIV